MDNIEMSAINLFLDFSIIVILIMIYFILYEWFIFMKWILLRILW